MDKKRPYYPTKAAWAAAEAEAIARQISAMPRATTWRERYRKAQACATLERRESRLRRLANPDPEFDLPF